MSLPAAENNRYPYQHHADLDPVVVVVLRAVFPALEDYWLFSAAAAVHDTRHAHPSVAAFCYFLSSRQPFSCLGEARKNQSRAGRLLVPKQLGTLHFLSDYDDSYSSTVPCLCDREQPDKYCCSRAKSSSQTMLLFFVFVAGKHLPRMMRL